VTLTHHFLASGIIVVSLALPVAARGGDEIRVYTVPKEQAVAATAPDQGAAAPADGATMPAADIPHSSARATWTTPGTWKELPPNGIRIADFSIPGQDGQKAEAAIFSFRGDVGSELDNVNRWRNELKLPQLESGKVASAPVTIDGMPGKLYEINGANGSIVAARLPREGDTWVFKMWGDKDVVADAEPVFRDFLKTIHITAAPSEAPSTAAVNNSGAANPHGDLSPPQSDAAAADGPHWIVPSNWKETAPGPMVFKRFSVADDAGKSAMVSVSVFQGPTGGTLMNVNRWRRQVGLAEVEESDLPTVTQGLDVAAGKATLVDFNGTDKEKGTPVRLVAVIVPHGDDTWFYKLMGDGAVVDKQKESFVQFVKTVRYP
jgi:hypothetical protein